MSIAIATVVKMMESLPENVQVQAAQYLREFIEQELWQEVPFRQTQDELSGNEFESLADRLATEMATQIDGHVLSDYAVSRAGIYEEHP